MLKKNSASIDLSRRQFLTTSGSLLLISVTPNLPATPAEQLQAITAEFGKSPINRGKVRLTLPSLAENGNSVRMNIAVESPMTADDYVESVHVFSEANPIPTMAGYYFTPECGRAQLQTRVRLHDTQNITAIARMSDGSLWSDSTHVLVTIAACANPWL